MCIRVVICQYVVYNMVLYMHGSFMPTFYEIVGRRKLIVANIYDIFICIQSISANDA